MTIESLLRWGRNTWNYPISSVYGVENISFVDCEVRHPWLEPSHGIHEKQYFQWNLFCFVEKQLSLVNENYHLLKKSIKRDEFSLGLHWIFNIEDFLLTVFWKPCSKKIEEIYIASIFIFIYFWSIRNIFCNSVLLISSVFNVHLDQERLFRFNFSLYKTSGSTR